MKCKTKALSHQICMAHLLNDLNYLTERYNHKGYPAYFKSSLKISSHNFMNSAE